MIQLLFVVFTFFPILLYTLELLIALRLCNSSSKIAKLLIWCVRRWNQTRQTYSCDTAMICNMDLGIKTPSPWLGMGCKLSLALNSVSWVQKKTSTLKNICKQAHTHSTNTARKQPCDYVKEPRWVSWKRSCSPASIIHRLCYLLLLEC